MNDIRIIKAQKHHLFALADILNSATDKLLKKGVMQWEYPWDNNEILSFIEKEEFYIVYYGDHCRACFGLKPFGDNLFQPEDKEGLYWYHLAVHPDYHKLGIGYRACRWVQNYAKEINRNIYFDCWRGNKSLINYYTFNGFTPLGTFPEEDYFVYAFKAEKE